MTLNLETLLAPIPGALPAGIDIRGSEEKSGLYYALKEKRVTARARERQADIEAERGGLAPEWRGVHDGAQALLRDETKDIEIATWLVEAALRLHGFTGLRDGLLLLVGLIERYWDTLHSVDTETVADKVAPIAGLNGLNAEGTLIQPMRLAPLAAPLGDEPTGLWLWQEARRRGGDSREAKRLSDAMQATPRDFFVVLSQDLEACWSALASLDRSLDATCGQDAPPLGTLRAVLQEAREALYQLSGIKPEALSPPLVQAQEIPGPEAGDTPETEARAASRDAGVLYNRDDALKELARVAAFFREREPHSPISYALETLIRRARLPLPDLLRELISDDAVRRSALSMAGITLDVVPPGSAPPGTPG